ncbi:MAG: 3-deoxy-D-manno-octulosonate 8-phosphate phosphatase KdsC [Burkholderia sp.]|jgi:3-deoxy-D-manno-octulosonate 8-phosphate phosphatase (KDO 8-P phosphatase)
MPTVLERARRVRMAVFDIDGVMSDGTINISGSGELYKSFYTRDGLGIKMLQKAGIEVAVITGRSSAIVAERMRELGITRVSQGQLFKTTAYEALLKETRLTDEQVAYMGDDVPDLPILMRAGLAAAPADCNPDLLNYTHWQSRFRGGRGAVRELCELILRAQGAWDRLVTDTYVLGK